MVSYIRVTSADKAYSWEKFGSQADYLEMLQLTKTSKEDLLVQDMMLFPVRTASLRYFAMDLFLPVTVNRFLWWVEKKVTPLTMQKLFVGLCIDVATIGSRLFTCIPRILYNQKQEETPLHAYLSSQEGIESGLLEADSVEVNDVLFKGRFYVEDGKEGIDGTFAVFSKYVNFLEVPVRRRAPGVFGGSFKGTIEDIEKDPALFGCLSGAKVAEQLRKRCPAFSSGSEIEEVVQF